VDEESPGESLEPSSPGSRNWLRNLNHNDDVVSFLRRARRTLPGDPEFGDPLSVAGVGGPRAAARAADRLLERNAVTREVSLGALQVWQALTEKVSGKPANPEVTLVFTDLVGFSAWSLTAGDDATLRLLRRVAQVVEPPLLQSGGHIVKRLGDGIMAVFGDAFTGVRSAIAAREALRTVDVEGYTPRMRVGVHTGHPQRIGSDWLGIDVNLAARVMERATRGGLVISGATLERIPPEQFESLGVTAKRLRRVMFAPKQDGVPDDFTMYRLRTRRQFPGDEGSEDAAAGA
jgi:class 3 adenylate cyclase